MWPTPLWTPFFPRFWPFFTPILLLPHPPDRPLAFTEQGVPRPPRRGLFPCHPTLSVFRALPWPLGPLRVRALVCVRCPRTGSPRRCRSPRYAPISIRRLILNEISFRRSPSMRYCSSITFLILLTSSSLSSRTFLSALTPAALRILFDCGRPMP